MALHWFKLSANFDKDDRVILLESQRGGDVAAYHYVKLNCAAARCNQGGGIYIAKDLPHTAKTLAKLWRLKEITVKNSLDLLVSVGLLEIYDGVYFIADWCELQSIDKLDEIREKARLRQRKWREKKKERVKQASLESNVTDALHNIVDIEIDKEIEKEIDIDGGDKEKIIEDYVSLFNTTAPSKIKFLSESQKDAIIKAVNEFGFERLRDSLEIAAKSDFLNGNNRFSWVANFDWLIKPQSIAKILNGNYDKAYSASGTPNCGIESSFNPDEFIEAAFNQGFG